MDYRLRAVEGGTDYRAPWSMGDIGLLWALTEELNKRYATSGKDHVLELGETDLGDPIAIIIDLTNPDAAIAFAREGGRYFISPWGARTAHSRSLRSLVTRILGCDVKVPDVIMKAIRNGMRRST